VTNNINGLVAWGNSSSGMRVYGGSLVKVRNSLLLGNTQYGVLISSDANTADGDNLGTIDLGTSGDPGQNYLQAPTSGVGPNAQGGICVNLTACNGTCPAPLTETLSAEGNYMVSATGNMQVNCASATTAISKGTCGGHRSDGLNVVAGITTTVDVAGCM
jgi:hypothetical protein